MHALCSYDYAVIRVVPRVEREEFINVGVIFSCPTHDFLEAQLHLDRARLRALDASVDVDAVEHYLLSIPVICRGGPDAFAIGRLAPRERFHWLVAPRSTIIQTSAVHSGHCTNPAQQLGQLMKTMVLPPAP